MKKDELLEFSNGIKAFKNRLNLSNKDVSKICGCSLPLIYNWENLTAFPTYQSLQKLHKFGMLNYEMFGAVDNLGNSNQCLDVFDLSQNVNAEIEKFYLLSIDKQTAYNSLTNAEKIAFLSKVINSHLEFISNANDLLNQLAENKENK